jgi:two-component system response regulator CiaR
VFKVKILVVEDDPAVGKAITAALCEEEWETDLAISGRTGLHYATDRSYDVIILDIMLPDMDGYGIVKALRGEAIMTPVLFLTARDSVQDRVKGLDSGADDYLTKPFEVAELLARVRALSRRKGSFIHENKVEYGRLSIQEQTRDGFVDKQPLNLTVKEYELLEYLLRNAEQILTREQVFCSVWGFDSDAGSAVVEVYVHYLRKKLAPFGCDKFIRTIRGVGYMVKE